MQEQEREDERSNGKERERVTKKNFLARKAREMSRWEEGEEDFPPSSLPLHTHMCVCKRGGRSGGKIFSPSCVHACTCDETRESRGGANFSSWERERERWAERESPEGEREGERAEERDGGRGRDFHNFNF